MNFCKIMKDRWFISHALIVFFLRFQFDKPFEIKQIKDKRGFTFNACALSVHRSFHARTFSYESKKANFFLFFFSKFKKGFIFCSNIDFIRKEIVN